jgi:hypothetical protein
VLKGLLYYLHQPHTVFRMPSANTNTARYPRALQPVQAVTVLQALDQAPSLARLTALARESQERLVAVADLLPGPLRPWVQAGPIEDQQWCLLAANNAVAAKLRQLAPALTAHLRAKGCEVTAIRIKVQTARVK